MHRLCRAPVCAKLKGSGASDDPRLFAVLNDECEPELRGPDDKFGRYMTVFRKQHTAGDTEPLGVVSGEPYRLPKDEGGELKVYT